MPITREQILAAAALCRIDLAVSSFVPPENAGRESAEEHVARITAQLDAVVGYLDILHQVNTEGVEPLYFPLEHSAPPRKDVVKKHLTADEILANAPKRQQTFFVVPPVI